MKKKFKNFISKKSIKKQISYVSKTTGISVEVMHDILQLPDLKSKLRVIEDIYEKMHIDVFGCATAEFYKKYHTSKTNVGENESSQIEQISKNLDTKSEENMYYNDIVLAKKYLSLLKKYNKTLVLILKFFSQDNLDGLRDSIKEYIKEFKNDPPL